MFHFKKAFGGLLFLFSSSAQAFIDPPVLQPAQPFAGQELSVFFRLGECEGFTDTAEEIDITVEGHVVTLLIDGSRRHDPT